MNENNTVKVIAVSGGKGGIGKTNISVNLAVGLAKLGRSVMLLDADLGMANIDIMLGIQPEYDLQHVISGECTLEEVIFNGPFGIKVIPASTGIGKMADLSVEEQGNIIRAFDDLPIDVDVLIIDTAAGISNSVINFTKSAQEIFVVVCDEPASITDAYSLIKVLNVEHGIKSFQILPNMVKNSDHGKKLFRKLVNVTDIYLDVSLGLLGSIPMDESLRKAVRNQSAVVEAFPHCAASIAFQQIVKRVDATPAPASSTGYMQFFIEKIARGDNSSREFAK
ncbi:MAG: MinD/ParA family protein [Gammaproteobacteria bacterium]|nr:MinD/ParA family protein [Gammaproteobacteria bacterium]